MRLEILLEPPGEAAEQVLRAWLKDGGLQQSEDGTIEVEPDRCLAVLADLRSRCYDRGLVVNSRFFGRGD